MLGKKDSRHVRGKGTGASRPQRGCPSHHKPWDLGTTAVLTTVAWSLVSACRALYTHPLHPSPPRYYYSHFPAQKVKLQTVCQLPKATGFSGEARDFPGSAT